jgi:hypothetical protein
LLGVLQPEGLGQKEAVLTQFGEASREAKTTMEKCGTMPKKN